MQIQVLVNQKKSQWVENDLVTEEQEEEKEICKFFSCIFFLFFYSVLLEENNSSSCFENLLNCISMKIIYDIIRI